MGFLHYKRDHGRSPTIEFPGRNCVAYHFPGRLEHFNGFCSEKKKAANAAALSSAVRACQRLVGFGVVLILVDALAHAIGFAIQLALVLLGQVAVVLGHILLLVILQSLFATLQPLRFSGS